MELYHPFHSDSAFLKKDTQDGTLHCRSYQVLKLKLHSLINLSSESGLYVLGKIEDG